MDNNQQHRSGDSFSFPSTPNPDSAADDDFEFGSLTPDSPNSSDPSRGSPADHLFFKGRLLPHSFPPPLQPHPTLLLYDTASRSNDSLLTLTTSSRSNSTNSSRSSSCNSARTSSSDSSERRLFHHNRMSSSGRRHHHQYGTNNKMAYGCSQRWQYITPVPATAAVFCRETSRRRKDEQAEKANTKTTTTEDRRLPVGRRIFRWLVMACKECHALEPSTKEKMLREHVKL